METAMDAGYLREAYTKNYSPEAFMRFYQALAEEFFLLAHPARAIPISPVPLVLDARFQERFHQIVSVLWETIADPRYRKLSAENIPRRLTHPGPEGPEPIAFDPHSNIGCIDLHLAGDGLRMIEFMVLPPGMSSIYPGMLARYGDYLEECVPGYRASCFSPGWDRARCEDALLEHTLGGTEPDRVAIIDWEPENQITYGEFQYTLHRLREKRGITGLTADPREVEWDGSGITVRGRPVDRILNRLTLLDWSLHHREIPGYTRLLWEAPHCFAYHPYLWYLGDKHSLTLLADPEVLNALDIDEESRKNLEHWIPPTFRLSLFRRPDGSGWDTDRMVERVGPPDETVLKPVSSHASKGILFGPVDLPTVESLENALRDITPEEYVAMKLIPPPEISVPRGQGRVETWKCDLRIFVLNGQYVFPGGRVYLGDYTNQVPCRTFAPLFFA
jgi:hypothetical protein